LALAEDDSHIISLHLESYDDNLISMAKENFGFPGFGPFFGFGYSQDYEFLDMQGQYLLSKKWLDPTDPSHNILTWYQAGSHYTMMNMIFKAPSYLPETINEVLLNQTQVSDFCSPSCFCAGLFVRVRKVSQCVFKKIAIATNSTPCADNLVVTGATDQICRALIDNSLHSLLETVNFPTILCHSPGTCVLFVFPVVHAYRYSTSLTLSNNDERRHGCCLREPSSSSIYQFLYSGLCTTC
jgi:hypothetical protein